MSYEKSLTTSVQNHIRSVLAAKVIRANTTQDIGSTAQEIRAFLADPATVSTPDFVMRRYLQTYHPGLLEDLGPLPDLIRSKQNVPWPEAAMTALTRKLAKLSREQGAEISATEWKRYFTGSVPTSRERFFQMAFTLKMDTAQTLDLLLAYGMEPYSVRQPLDLICLFCQKIGGTYTWAQAEQMHAQFMARRTHKAGGDAVPTPGGTMQIQSDLNALFERSLQGSNAQQALIDYMVENSGEFISFLDKVKEKGKKEDKDEDKDKDEVKYKEIFLPGYTQRRSALFGRLARYLAVLYPKVSTPSKCKNEGGNPRLMDLLQWETDDEYVVNKDTGKISLTILVRAMFLATGWLDLEWKTDSKRGSFDYNMRIFCTNYKQHIGKVHRLYTRGKDIAFFERRDALLFIFFLLNGYIRLLAFDDYGSRRQIAALKKMAASGDSFDAAVGEVLCQVASLQEEKYYAPDAYFRGLCQCFDMILSQMDYNRLYLPAQFDRFVLLALLAEEPEELSGLIMSEAELEEYDTPFPKPLPKRTNV